MLHPLMLAPRADRLIQRIIRPGRAKLDAVILAKPGDRRLVQNNLRHRREFNHRQLLGGALRHRIKAPRAVQHIAEQVEPDRPALARWKNINDAATHRVIARL
ncbi:hypothetical protein GALL_488690 [mine drainage metagenome]|uniref:Uncharacterized protein n=1 Tax=mine drainage metagenome TaxID=410659 RepID=A0A1J5PD14_9ZZZZ